MSYWLFVCDSNVSLTVSFAFQKHCSMRPFVLLLGRFSSFSCHFKWYILPTAFSLFFPWCTPGSASKQFPCGGPSAAVSVLYLLCQRGFFLGHKHKTRENNNYKTYFYYLHQTMRESCAVKVFLQLAKKVGCLKGQSHKGRVLQKMRDIFSMVILK